MDNTGPYLKYDELILEMKLGGSTKVSSVGDVTLSNKTPDAGGAIFEYTPNSPAVKVGDVINQIGKSAIVKAVLTTPDRLQLEDLDDGTTDIENGSAEVLRSESVPRFRGEDLIGQAMDFIDEVTGQFFNARQATVRLEGNNTPTMWLPVPIINIDKLVINSTAEELLEGEDKDFVAFKGRARPQDDRRNPRIKLNVGRGRDSIFTGAVTNRVFVKETLTEIQGTFGFLDPDGSTPSLIKQATAILALDLINAPIAQNAGQDTGPLKRIKVDLHEQEFFEKQSITRKSSVSENSKVDQILARFKAPIRIDGSIEWTPVVMDKASRGATY